MDFNPTTEIWFCRTGIDDFNKVVCDTMEDTFSVITRDGNVQGRMQECSFQRADNNFTIRVDHSDVPYYGLMQCDTVIYRNNEVVAAFWIVGNILSVDWKNPDCSFVTFKIDYFMTYQHMIQWDKTHAFIEREHVKEDWSGDGGNPLFSNIGPAEDFNVMPDTPIYIWTNDHTCSQLAIYSPYDENGKPTFDVRVDGGLPNGINLHLMGADAAAAYFNKIAEEKEASINNIVGVYGVPTDLVPILGLGSGDKYETESLPAVNVAAKELPGVPQYNNAKCWSAPFYKIRLMSSEGEVVDYNPQWFGNDQSNYSLELATCVVGQQFAGYYATFKNKSGVFDWKAYADFMVSIHELPRLMWTADGFTDWQAMNGTGIVANIIKSSLAPAVSGVASAMLSSNPITLPVGMALGGLTAVNTVNAFADKIAPVMQASATGATVKGGGTFSRLGDLSMNAFGFKVIYYGTQPYIMLSIDSYFDRFGYRINKLKKLERANRPIWTYIKTSECHVIPNPGVPFIGEQQINATFNYGVTLWTKEKYMSGRKIGDFSNAKENRGLKG